MKKLFLLGMILLLTIGCSSNKNNSTQKEKKEEEDIVAKFYKKSKLTMCYSFSHSAEPDEDGITDMSIINTHAYDDLSDNQFYLNFDITFTFDNYEAANKFYKEEKEEKKYKDKEIKITEDIDNQETEVNINKYVLVSQNVRDFIHKLQNDGYECKTGTSDEEE